MPRRFAHILCAQLLTVCAWGSGAPPASAFAAAGSQQFTRFYMPQAADDNGPACLDGSPPVVYFRPGTGSGANKWIVYHQGGGWCTSPSSCENRSHNDFGSSSSYPPTTENMKMQQMSTDKNVAPGWYNWNQLYMKYCDGASFSGDRDGTVLEKGTKLYYRGYRNLRAMMNWALEHGLGNGTELIVHGGSAGGLATFLHVAEWCHVFESSSLYDGEGTLLDGQVPGKKKCVGAPDAGFFPDIGFTSTEAKSLFSDKELDMLRGGPNYANNLRWVYTNQNVTVNHRCQKYYEGNDKSKCMFAEHTAPFILQPVFVLNSVYDSWQIAFELPKDHTDVLVNKLGRLMIDRINKNVLEVNPKAGAWLTGCSQHTTLPNWLTAGVDGMRAPDAMMQWYAELDEDKPKRSWIASDKYPCSQAVCCNNFYSTSAQMEEAAIE